MTWSNAKRLRVSGCLPLDDETVGFSIPLFADPTNPGMRAVQQVDELTETVVGFRVLVLDDDATVIPVSGPLIAVGDPQVYVFITEKSEVHVGTLVSLRPLLESYARQNP